MVLDCKAGYLKAKLQIIVELNKEYGYAIQTAERR